MIQQMLKHVIIGVAWGTFVTFFALTILIITNTESSVTTIWLYMGASLFLGVYFSLATFIFTLDQWSPLKQIIIHFSLSYIVYFTIAFPLGWVPFSLTVAVLSTILFILIYIVCWFCFRLYYRNITNRLNKSLEGKK